VLRHGSHGVLEEVRSSNAKTREVGDEDRDRRLATD
jgi:hypothetical protein